MGYKSRTRNLFARPFRKSGQIPSTTYINNYKSGDYVDIVVNSSSHCHIPHKNYKGRTGVVWNITKRAVGVEINKKVLGRILRKRIHVRVEHLRPSNCREDHIRRIDLNQKLKEKYNSLGKKIESKDKTTKEKLVDREKILHK